VNTATGPLYIAHRAGNSLRTLRRAEAAGADVVEVDVFLRSGRVEVRHSKTMGRVPVLWDRWRLERGWGRRVFLEDILQAANESTQLMVDIKRHRQGLSEAVAGVMESTRPGAGYLVCSQDWEAVDPFVDNDAATPVYSVGSDAGLARFLSRFEEGGSVGCSIHERFLDERTAAAIVGRTTLVMSWPVNTAGRVAALMKLGVRGMITDRLDLITARTAEATPTRV
jgi:glycerophosphoryl diester phosphodiesterase